MGRALDNAIKFNTVEDNASADFTASEIKTAYEANADTNPFTDTHEAILADIGESVTWTNATLLNGWVEYGTSWGVAGYYKDPSGTVYIRGLVKSGTIGSSPIFILPVGYRPVGRKILCASSNNGHGRLDITNDGQVLPVSGSNTWYSISCCFKAEQ